MLLEAGNTLELLGTLLNIALYIYTGSIIYFDRSEAREQRLGFFVFCILFVVGVVVCSMAIFPIIIAAAHETLSSMFGKRQEWSMLAILGVTSFIIFLINAVLIRTFMKMALKRSRDTGSNKISAWLLMIPVLNILVFIALLFWPSQQTSTFARTQG